ncbi:MAG: hypothetical protein Kow0098_01380 [Ignavibacteriaceae bacterium]
MGQRKIDLSKPVKFIKPLNKAESKLIFRVVNYNEVTNRVYIQPINTNLTFPPQELVSIDDIENLVVVK